MNYISFVPPLQCGKIAKRLKKQDAEIEIYPTEHHLEPTMVINADDCNCIGNAFQDAAEKGGEYACNILKSSADRHGIPVKILAASI